MTVRVRHDFQIAQARCEREQARRYRDRRHFYCNLPDECDECRRWVCNRCEGLFPWSVGGADDMPGVCDECFAFVDMAEGATP
jgi:hypothetical protein